VTRISFDCYLHTILARSCVIVVVSSSPPTHTPPFVVEFHVITSSHFTLHKRVINAVISLTTMVFHLLFHLQRRHLTPRQMKVVLLLILLLLTFFLTTFNATLWFIVDSRVEQIAYRDHQRGGQSSLGGVQHHHSTQQHAFSSDNVEQRSDDDDEDQGAKNTDEGIENDDEDQQQQWIRDRDRVKKFKTQ
jgi:hypothetical protein